MSLNIDYLPYFGVPFRRGARGPDELDCHGLLVKLHADQNVTIPDFKTPDSNDVAAELLLANRSDWRAKWEPSTPGDICPHHLYEPGDTLLYRIYGIPCHVGMVVSDLRFVHTWQGTRGVTCERMTLWERRLHGLYRHHSFG